MLQKRRKSLILYGAERFAGFLRDLFAKSLLLGMLSDACVRVESAFHKGRFHSMSDAEIDRNAWQYRFRQGCLRAFESSLFLRLQRAFSDCLLKTSVSSFGSFGMLYGAFSASLWFLRGPAERETSTLLASLILTVLSMLLTHTRVSLSYVIRHSVIAGSFLFGFCAIPQERFDADKQGAERHWQALFLALIMGVTSLIVPSVWFLALIFLALVLLLFFSVPELPAVLLLLLLPFLNFFSHPSIFLCGFVLFADAAWLSKALCGRRRLRLGAIDFTVLLFGASILFSGIVGAGGYAGVQNGGMMLILLSFWFPAVSLFSQKVWRDRALTVLKLSGFLCAVYGILQYFFTDMELLWVDVSRFSDIGGRVCGPFQNPNMLAVYLLLVSPLMLAGVFDTERSFLARLWNGASFLCTVLCLILTWSRGAWLGMIAVILFFLVSYSRRSLGALMLSVIPFISALPFLPHSILNRFSSIGSLSEPSIRYRLYTWRGVLRMLYEHPWGIGVGAEAFHRIYPQYAVSGTESVMHAHQLFLQIAVELGFSGLIVYLFFLLQLLFDVAYGLKYLHGAPRAQMLGCACAVLGVTVMGFFDYVWYHFGMFFLFFVICAALTLHGGQEREGYDGYAS